MNRATALVGLATVTLSAAIAGLGLARADESSPPESQDHALMALDDPVVDLVGTIEVAWETVAGTERAEVDVAAVDGTFVARHDGAAYAADASGNVFELDGEWAIISAAGGARPDPRDKYELTTAPGEPIAGRPSTTVEASYGGAVTQRIAFDAEYGFVLGHEWLDPDGAPRRSVRFLALTVGTSDADPISPIVPDDPQQDAPESLDDVGAPFTDPDRAFPGYRLVERLDHGDGLIQLEYSDGLARVSVFERHGELDRASVPDGGGWVEVAGHSTYELVTARGWLLVWEDDEIVYTVIGDAPRLELEQFADQVDGENRGTLAQLADGLVDLFSF